MINGLGVLGWGVGGVEAEAVMLGQPISMVLPKVVGYKITGKVEAFVTSTDVVLTITKHLRQVEWKSITSLNLLQKDFDIEWWFKVRLVC